MSIFGKQGIKCYYYTEKYVNPETYNLLDVSAYENADNQSCAYYWLGVTAGQVFHEHYEAIEYLNRALEITADRKTYEELAQNYLAQAEEKIKYRKNAKYYEIDKASLLKAKRCFQYAMQTDDEEMRLSVYRKSGAAYLQVLFHLKRYYDYEEFFARAEKVLPDSYELFMQKAECDALFYYEVSEERLNALKKNDRIYIEAVRDFAKAGFYQGQKKEDESKELYRKIISVIEGLAVTDMRFRALFHDSFFFLGDAEGYNRYADLWDSDMQGFGQEINARIAEAEKTLIFAYEQNPDISTFSMLNGFYVRQHMKNESEALYENALSEKAPFVSERVDLIRGYLLQQLHIWGDLGHAVEIFLEYQREFDEDLLSKQEIVEILKQETADYGDVDNRVQWNRYLLKIAPKAAAAQMYRCMFFLYVSNFRYKEAEEILLEMQRSGYSVPKEWRSIHDILMRPQKKQIYFRGVINFSADFLAGLKEKMRGNSLFFRYCFGAENKEVLLPISWILLLFQFGRQKELERFKTVYIVYAGVVNLQKSLCGKEDALLRMALQNLQKADNIKIAAPSLEGFYNQIKGKKKCQMEAVQLKAYKKEHPEIWCPV